MKKDLSNYRKVYEKGTLCKSKMPQTPMALFADWFNDIDIHFKDIEVNAMTLSTIGLDGFPKSRVVLLKQFTNEGFIFFTNYNSEKGKAIAAQPKVCISFFWEAAQRQVIIKGEVAKISKNESVTYFNSRPRGSQLGALVSHQSEVIKSRAILEEGLAALDQEFQNKPIPMPEHWGGYLITPIEFEFWQGRENRLHDRIRYTLQPNKLWNIERLAP